MCVVVGGEAEVSLYTVQVRRSWGWEDFLTSPYIKHTGRTMERFLTQGDPESTS